MLISFAGLQPDLEAFNNPGALQALNCVPTARSYGPLRGPKAFGAALAARPLNAVSFADTKTGTTFSIAGTATNLCRLVGGVWTSIASGFTADQRNGWGFQKVGRKLVCAPGNHPLVGVNLDSGAVADIAGSPQATSLAVVGGYLFAGLQETLCNSGINNPLDWAYGGATGADQQPILTGGAITGLSGGEIGFCFLENAIRRISPRADINYDFPEVETDQGCIVPGSLVKFRSEAFYLARNGFYRFNGSGSTPIGEDRIDKTFWRNVDEGQLDAMRAAIDPINKLVIWSYPSRSAPNRGYCDRLLFYHYNQDRWSEGAIETSLILTSVTEGVHVDSGGGTSDIDGSSELVDSRVFLGGSPILSIADRLNQFATLTGDVLPATLQTGEVELGKKGAVHLQNARPVVDGATATLTAQIRDWQSDAPRTVGSTVHPDRPAVANFDRAHCRFARFQIDIAAGAAWKHAMGVEVDDFAKGGER